MKKILIQNIQRTITKSLLNIQKQQQENGGFISITSDDAIFSSACTQTRTTFYPSLIAGMLKNNTDSVSVSIKEKVGLFLLHEKNAAGAFNYCQKENNSIFQYPDDMDDTFLALQAMNAIDWHAVIQLLIQNETREGGPYYTWIMPQEGRTIAWRNIDIVVNSNISCFLAQHGIHLPALEYFFNDCIINDMLHSQYYHEEYMVIYFLSKSYDGIHAEILRQKLSYKMQNGHWNSVLETACCISSLLRLGEDPVHLIPAIEWLMETMKEEYHLSPFFIESKKGSTVRYSTCKPAVLACCVEALMLCLGSANQNILKENDEHISFIHDVTEMSRMRFQETSPCLQKQFHKALQQLAIKDPKNEIILLSCAIAMQLPYAVSPDTVTELSLANLFGWIGYSIKDSIMDHEPFLELLPCATICIRETIHLFENHANKSFSKKDISLLLDQIEITQVWEQSHCRLFMEKNIIIIPETLPEYGNHAVLAHKSFGHAIGPILLACMAKDKKHIIYMKEFFLHYLIARQLNDDAHDWLEDLRNGFVNSTSVEIIKIWQMKNDATSIDLNADQNILQELFWEDALDSICQNILDHVTQAKAVLQKITILEDGDFLEQLLYPLEQSAMKALTERDMTRELIMQLQ